MRRYFFAPLLFIGILFVNYANAVSLRSAETSAKIISEAYEAAKAEKAAEVAKDASKLNSIGKEAKNTKPANAYSFGVVAATGKIIMQCKQGKKIPETSWCASQKDRVYSCIQSKVEKGMLLNYASKECEIKAQ